MSGVLKNKVAIVTGGGAGMGRAVAERFAREGAEVVVSEDRPEARPGHGRKYLCNRRQSALCFKPMWAKNPRVTSLADTVKTSYGQVDILYNNAAVLYLTLRPDSRTVFRDLGTYFYGVNLRGLWLCSKYVGSHDATGPVVPSFTLVPPTALEWVGGGDDCVLRHQGRGIDFQLKQWRWIIREATFA